MLLHRFTGATYSELMRLAPAEMWARVAACAAALDAAKEASDDDSPSDVDMPDSM